jgi:type IV fimbrial biogenesis protein FimT
MKTFQNTTRRQAGLTLVESLICLAVAAVGAGAALPSLQQTIERRHLEGASAQLATDIRLARSAAVAQRTSVRLSVQRDGAQSCYVIHTGNTGDCRCTGTGEAVCRGAAQTLRVVGFASSHPVHISASASNLQFDPDRGTVTPTSTLRLQGRGDQAIHQVVNIMGRTRSCSPGALVPGHTAC